MNEKRFIRDGKYVFDTERETVLDIDLICILLNRFAEENEQLRKKLECCEYSHFLNELDAIHEKVDKGDLSDFGTLTISDKG